MEHYKYEYANRGGCPADWVWIVPPVSGSLVPTFHQEMLNYKMSPSFEYQDPLFTKSAMKRKIALKVLMKVVYFCISLYLKRHKKRKEILVFYGTMTGTAKTYATKFDKCLKLQFKTELMPLDRNTLEIVKNKIASMKSCLASNDMYYNSVHRSNCCFHHNLNIWQW